MKLNKDVQNILESCQSLTDESRRLSYVLDDYESLMLKLYEVAEGSTGKLSVTILSILDDFSEL